MNAKKSGLGRGLSELGLGELLSGVKAPVGSTIASKGSVVNEDKGEFSSSIGLRKMAIELLHPNRYQPRQEIDNISLAELAASIKTQGIIQPILVRPSSGAGEDYEIIAGERRWRAAQLAGLAEVPIIIKELSDEQAAAIALIENLQREDLNAIDTAQGLQRLIDEFGMTHQTAAEAIGKSRVTVTNLLRLLNLPEIVKNMVQRGELEMGHARALLALPAYQQLQIATTIIRKNLSVRATEELIQKLQKSSKQDLKSQNNQTDPDVMQLEQKMSDALGAKVKIQYVGKDKQRGKLIVYYNNLDVFDGILEKILL